MATDFDDQADATTGASGRYQLLHRPVRWEWACITMRFRTDLPRDDLVSSTHVIAFVDDEVILCRDQRPGVWFLPGGTREPGELIAASLDRELLEEAGARLLGAFHPIGAHVGVSDADQPYRPHLPHPEKAWLWRAAMVSCPRTKICTDLRLLQSLALSHPVGRTDAKPLPRTAAALLQVMFNFGLRVAFSGENTRNTLRRRRPSSATPSSCSVPAGPAFRRCIRA